MSNILQNIYQSAFRLMEPLDTEQMFAIAVEEAKKLVGADYGSIFLEKKGQLVRVYSSVPIASQLTPRKNDYAYRALAEGKPFVFSREEAKKIYPTLLKTPIKLVVVIPLSIHHHSIGVLTLQSTKAHRFSQQKLDVLTLFGSLVTLRIRNVELLSEMQTAVQTRDLFISMASHELKTPLTTILGYVQLIESKVKANKPINPEWVSSLKSEAFRLNRLFNELLHVDQAKSGHLDYSFGPSNLKDVIVHAIDDLHFSYPQYTFTLEVSGEEKDFLLTIDKEKLLQVFINLLTNAAKFSPQNKSVHILLAKKKTCISIKVQDSGIGIAKKNLPRIFEEFYKAHDSTYEGIGLGLFLTKKIIDRHKGTIQVHSQKGKGTTIEIELPLV